MFIHGFGAHVGHVHRRCSELARPSCGACWRRIASATRPRSWRRASPPASSCHSTPLGRGRAHTADLRWSAWRPPCGGAPGPWAPGRSTLPNGWRWWPTPWPLKAASRALPRATCARIPPGAPARRAAAGLCLRVLRRGGGASATGPRGGSALPPSAPAGGALAVDGA